MAIYKATDDKMLVKYNNADKKFGRRPSS